MSRRRLVTGAAWALPAVSVAAAAPAFAASCAGLGTTKIYNYTGGTQTLTIPASGCARITFDIYAGNGGWSPSANGGYGARFQGTITRSSASAITLTLYVAGGGKADSTSGNLGVLKGGWGYGLGGDVPAAPTATTAGWGCAGGGASAILVGGTPVIVAGGGGGAGHGASGAGLCTAPAAVYPAGTSTYGGNANGTSTAADAYTSIFNSTIASCTALPQPAVTGTIHAALPGGGGASGTTPGTCGPPDLRACAWPSTAFWGGYQGGNGSGRNGGNGGVATSAAAGSSFSTPNALTSPIAPGGGGGGGYAGGAGGCGGGIWCGSEPTWCGAAGTFGAGGGAGSSYTGGGGGLGVSVSSNGASNPNNTPGPGNWSGADGQITITYW